MKALPVEFRAAALAVLLLGCSEDESEPEPPPLARLELKSPGTTSGTPPCVARGTDPRQSIVVEVDIDHFTLRPPLGCTVNECGMLRLTLEQGDVKVSTDSAQATTTLPTTAFADGVIDIKAQLLNTFGEPYTSREDLKARCPDDCLRSFTLQTSCGGEPPGEPEPVTEPEPSASEDAGSTDTTDSNTGGSDISSSDTSATGANTEPAETDAAVPVLDAGSALPDAGPALSDAGNDAGVPAALSDAATPVVDAAVPAPDASPADAGTVSDAAAP